MSSVPGATHIPLIGVLLLVASFVSDRKVELLVDVSLGRALPDCITTRALAADCWLWMN
jgi:hypothetical protein